jgi:hypothetical protein
MPRPAQFVLCLLLLGGTAWAGTVRDIDGRVAVLFQPAARASVLFFVCTDCPVSNSYAPEIQRICNDYASKGVTCWLVYEDVDARIDAVRRHLEEYGYKGIAAVIDTQRNISNRAKATVTPEAVIVDHRGELRYRGRIDNFYAALGKPRREATEHDVRDALDAVLAGRPVAHLETKAWGCYIVDPEVLKSR